ncbi:hypothetical protein BDV96DRAFT_586309 [Lophiotrema nucula]|uniref:Uncharacterized protein n=1 Tax=Lophiotrema nucula TaxID=690887 RepID=A0A6A5YPQ4_9PLEO|nr:hypothetical protein BDV96DRAFT_586309 [Lophiotrema nucula]
MVCCVSTPNKQILAMATKSGVHRKSEGNYRKFRALASVDSSLEEMDDLGMPMRWGKSLTSRACIVGLIATSRIHCLGPNSKSHREIRY